jgi:hypothetical protein
MTFVPGTIFAAAKRKSRDRQNVKKIFLRKSFGTGVLPCGKEVVPGGTYFVLAATKAEAIVLGVETIIPEVGQICFSLLLRFKN